MISINKFTCALVGVLTLVFLVVMKADIHYTESDPRASLLVSEALISHGTIRLDHYGEELINSYGYVIHEKNGHYYYYFPLGTSLVSVPFVALANLFGVEMVEREKKAQILIAALVAVATLLALLVLARRFLPPWPALLAASVFWFGTSFASTTGTALWSHNFASLFALLAILLVVRGVAEGYCRRWALVSLLLFLAYLCRPTMALLAPFLILFLFFSQRLAGVKVAGLLALLLMAFSAFSYWEFGQPLPDYYLPGRMIGEHFLDAVYGNLFSPARGLLVYSPFILLALLFFKPARRFDIPATWLLIGLVWPLVHLVLVSRFPHWWAGGSYGARFMLDILPGLYLLMLRCWPVSASGPAWVSAGVLTVSCLFAVYVNAYQGLFNRYTVRWNQEPNIDINSKFLFDWKYPQFLHNEERHESRLKEADRDQVLGPALFVVNFDAGEPVRFINWSQFHGDSRWNDGRDAIVEFIAPSADYAGKLTLISEYLGRQTIEVAINGHALGSYAARNARSDITLDFPPVILRPGEVNRLEFTFPNARLLGNGDPRLLAMSLKSVEIR